MWLCAQCRRHLSGSSPIPMGHWLGYTSGKRTLWTPAPKSREDPDSFIFNITGRENIRLHLLFPWLAMHQDINKNVSTLNIHAFHIAVINAAIINNSSLKQCTQGVLWALTNGTASPNFLPEGSQPQQDETTSLPIEEGSFSLNTAGFRQKKRLYMLFLHIYWKCIFCVWIFDLKHI